MRFPDLPMSIDHLIQSLAGYNRRFPNHPNLQYVARQLVRLISSLGGHTYRNEFEGVQKFCLFVGHARSGHSLIGSLLDAHPHIIIAHELHAMDYIKRGLVTTKQQLFYTLLCRSRWFEQRGAEWTGYKYSVPSQYKGEFTSLKVIGDKRGGGSTRALYNNPSLIEKIKDTVGVPIDVFHVTRHPLDNISTLARKDFNGNIEAATERYFENCRVIEDVKADLSSREEISWIEVGHEEIISESKSCLYRMCNFLDVSCSEDYVNDCANIIFDSPNRSRRKISYEPIHLDVIRSNTEEFSFLKKYAF